VPVRANELLAVSRLRFRAAVGLLTDHTTQRDHMYKLRFTDKQECLLCGDVKVNSVHIVCDCPVLVCKRYRILAACFSDLRTYRK
jgi:virulence-associated protein VapD